MPGRINSPSNNLQLSFLRQTKWLLQVLVGGTYFSVVYNEPFLRLNYQSLFFKDFETCWNIKLKLVTVCCNVVPGF